MTVNKRESVAGPSHHVNETAFPRRLCRQHPIWSVCYFWSLHPGLTLLTSFSGLSEEQITDIFSSAGKVERFRLVYDSETGRPKGFGFADYPDTGTMSSFSGYSFTRLTHYHRLGLLRRAQSERLRDHGAQASR